MPIGSPAEIFTDVAHIKDSLLLIVARLRRPICGKARLFRNASLNAASPPAAEPQSFMTLTEKQSFSANRWAKPEEIKLKIDWRRPKDSLITQQPRLFQNCRNPTNENFLQVSASRAFWGVISRQRSVFRRISCGRGSGLRLVTCATNRGVGCRLRPAERTA